MLLARLRILDRLTNCILGLLRRGRVVPDLSTQEFLHQTGGYGVAHVLVGENARVAGSGLKDIGFNERCITVLAIERGDKVIPFPAVEETVLAGDYLLCYGKVTEVISITQ